MPKSKVCGRCKVLLDAEHFSTRGKYLQSYCRKCNNEVTVAWQHGNIETVKGRYRQYNVKRYGISIDDYDVLYKEQNGQCGICGDFYPLLAIDHSHETNKVRGLLCRNCNSGIGLLRENRDILLNAIEWLNDD